MVKLNRGKKKESSYKKIDGVIVKPCLYEGNIVGVLNGVIVRDRDGRPTPYKQIISDKDKEKVVKINAT